MATGSTATTPEHPARFSRPVIERLTERLSSLLDTDALILDPFAGVGGIHELPWRTIGVEIEPEWAAAHPDTLCGDSTQLSDLIAPESIDAVVTSPAYGNRMADNYAGDGTRRFTYRTALGRPLSEGSGAGLQWGDAYRTLHAIVWHECCTVLRPGGLALINVSNHVRAGQEMPVVEWHLKTLLDIGFGVVGVDSIKTMRVGFGANRNLRVADEKLLVMRKTCADAST